MKTFRKLIAGAMAIAMLSVYMAAFAAGNPQSVTSGSVSGAGSYAGESSPVFLMKLPTNAANSSLAFTVDPEKRVDSSKPEGADPDSTYGTVIFSTTSGTGANATTVYKDESEPLKVISMSSVDVKVSMLATLSETKMTLSTTSGFDGTDSDKHLFLGVQVSTLSGADATLVSGGSLYLKALGAKSEETIATVPANFKTKIGATGAVETLVSGSSNANENATYAAAISDDEWKGLQYTVIGAANADADWDVEGIKAPNLTIKWVITPSNEITYEIPDPRDTATTATYEGILDRNIYKAGELVTVYVKPVSATAKLKSVKFKYVSLKATDGTMDKETTVTADLVGTKDASTGIVTPTAVNGVYSATFKVPDNMARHNSPAGATITSYYAPTFDIVVG